MKALCIQAPGEVGLVEVPTPPRQPGEALLRVDRVGYCGSDLNTFRGGNPLVTYPRIPGHEIAATILELPDGGGEFSAGQAVLAIPYTNCGVCAACRIGRINCCRDNQTLGVQRDGGLCEFLGIPTEKLLAAPGLSARELALVEPLTIGFHAINRGGYAAGDDVAVFGCGAIGLGAIAGAARKGARVIAIDVDDAKLELARQAGAAETIHSLRESLHERLRELTNGDGPRGAVEAVGLPQTFRAAVEEVCHAGTVVYIGYAREAVSYETKLFVQKELDIRGSRNATRREFLEVIEHLQSGRFPVRETVSREVTLDDAPAAMRDWAANPAKVTKIQVVL